MRAIQLYLPNPRHVELHRITCAAAPEAAWQAARHFDGANIPWVRFIFDLRALPGKLFGHEPPSQDRRLGVDQVAASGAGFMVLEEQAGREVVVGAVGRFWHLEIPFATVAPSDFAKHGEPGWGKVAWAIRVEPLGPGSQIVLELRTTATDEESWHKLERYFLVIGSVSHLIRSSVMSHLETELGPLARPSDKERGLPGDEFVRDAHYSLTHGIDIEAPRELVWPWLMQLGCDRGGWYSIDALDHAGVPSVAALFPDWRARSVGERVAVTPTKDSFYEVLSSEPNEQLVLGGQSDRLAGHVEMSWSFVLEPLGADASHLVTRVRARGTPRWSEWLQAAVIFPPLHALMQRAQLENLKRLAEQAALARR